KGAHNPDGARDLLATIGSVDGENLFNPSNGSTPPRRTALDAGGSGYDQDAKNTIRDFTTKPLLRATPSILPAAFVAPVAAALRVFLQDQAHDPAPVIRALGYYYGLLGH